MRVHGVVDRIEDDVAVVVLDDEKKINIPVKYLPSNVMEGDVIDISLNVNKEETVKRARKLKKLMEDVFEED
ncbi:DUF3006 domain-containing protein [Thermoanaerobacterium sp. RBIITD]|uniref:DUF3006 domain-containing protein n=1 Tax=Thermoanaerobacterium sp. RBIITD TaxID=1550240 RepID=UPI000BB98A55|nr:DUF3006 domain-containing protein [Thermoanaerobacterium sp. RBIITD]SNX52809.1 Protein of unknown function [Thermoanaerobacterium sp. RBIITD]